MRSRTASQPAFRSALTMVDGGNEDGGPMDCIDHTVRELRDHGVTISASSLGIAQRAGLDVVEASANFRTEAAAQSWTPCLQEPFGFIQLLDSLLMDG